MYRRSNLKILNVDTLLPREEQDMCQEGSVIKLVRLQEASFRVRESDEALVGLPLR